jgi:hypothetical protein
MPIQLFGTQTVAPPGLQFATSLRANRAKHPRRVHLQEMLATMKHETACCGASWIYGPEPLRQGDYLCPDCARKMGIWS